jgi:hypothetical protein
MAALGLGAYGAAVTSAELLGFVIKTAGQVKRLKAECAEVQVIAVLLKGVIEKNKGILHDSQTAQKLESLLRSVAQFVVWCTQSNIIRRVWEVTWKHRLPALLKDMMLWVTLLSTETSVSVYSSLLNCALITPLDIDSQRVGGAYAEIDGAFHHRESNLEERFTDAFNT